MVGLMAKKNTKYVEEEFKFVYSSELSIEDYKLLRKHGNFPELSDEQIEFIFNKNGWRYCCKIDDVPIAMCRFLCDEASFLIITDIVVHTSWRIDKAKLPERLIGGVVDYVKGVLQPDEELQVYLCNMDPCTKSHLEKLGYAPAPNVLYKIVKQ